MKFCTIVSATMVLAACTTDSMNLDSQKHIELLQEDRAKINPIVTQGQELQLSLKDALQLGVKYNLDAQVAALEVLASEGEIDIARLNAVPAFSLSGNYIGRSNKGAASSRSIVTGTQSLEPSYSTEQFRHAQDLTMNWSTLNVLLAVSQAQNAKTQARMAAERYDKVILNIQKDVYAAYFRALAAQNSERETEVLIRKASKQLNNLKEATNKKLLSRQALALKERELQEKISTLRNQQTQMSLVMIELKSLLSLPQSTELNLTTKLKVPAAEIKDILQSDIRGLEAEAIKNRPEIREQVLQRDVNLQNIREELVRTLPGGELFFAINKDSNQFLNQSQWGNFTVSVEQNLAALLSYPARKKNAKNQKEVEDARRRSLILAVMTQVHLARQRLDFLNKTYKDTKNEYANADYLAYVAGKKKKAGFQTSQDALSDQLEAQIKKNEYYQSLTELQDAYATMQNTLARGLLKQD